LTLCVSLLSHTRSTLTKAAKPCHVVSKFLNVCTPAQFAEEQTLEIERTAATVRQALVELGDAVGGNAKDVEAVVRLVKDMVQGKLASPGSNNKTVRAELGKLDTMLSQAWAAAKREAFMGAEPNNRGHSHRGYSWLRRGQG